MTHVDLEAVRGHVETLRWARERIAEINELKKSAEDAIKELLGDNDIGKLDGQTVVTWTTHKKRQFQQRAFAEEYPELAVAYTQLVEQRTFKVPE